MKGYFDGESDTVLAPDESVKIEMKPAVNNVKESDIISLVSNFKNYDYNFDFPRYPYMLYDTFPKGLLAEDDSVNPPIITKQTNCVSFAQALLVKAWENKVPNFTWSREKLLDWVVSKEAGSANRFAGIRRVISEGMGVEVIEENTPDWVPPPWTLVQRFNYSESSINWGSGHNFIIVDVHPQTKRLLILEANSPLADRGSNPKQAGPQFRALGHIDKFEQKNYSPGTDWWKEKSLDRWDDIKNPYIKMARLKVFDLNWVR